MLKLAGVEDDAEAVIASMDGLDMKLILLGIEDETEIPIVAIDGLDMFMLNGIEDIGEVDMASIE